MTSATEKKYSTYMPWLIVMGAIAFTALIRMRLLGLPLERDEGEYAYMAQLLLQGIPPYLQAYSMKFPGIYFVYAFIMTIFGQTTTGIHQGLLIVNALTICLIFILAKRFFAPMIAAIAAVVFSSMSCGISVLGITANAEHFLILPIVAGCILLLDSQEPGKLFLSGIIFGIALLVKQHAIYFILFALLFIVYSRKYIDTLRTTTPWKQSTYFALGASIPFFIMAIWLYAVGAFDKFWFWTFLYAKEYSTLHSTAGLSTTISYCLSQMRSALLPCFLFWILAICGLFLLSWSRFERKKSLFLSGFFLSSLLAVFHGFHLTPHYFIMALPGASLLICATFQKIYSSLKDQTSLSKIIVLSGTLLAGVVFIPLFYDSAILSSKDLNGSSHKIYGLNPFPEAVTIAEHLKTKMKSNETLAILGSEPEIYFYLKKPGSIKYIYMYPLMEEHPYVFKMQDELRTQLDMIKPDYIIFAHAFSSWFIYSVPPTISQPFFDWLYPFLGKNYSVVGMITIDPENSSAFLFGDRAALYVPSDPKDYYIQIYKKKSNFPI